MNTNVNTSLVLPGYLLIEQLYCGSRTLVYRGIRLVDEMPVVLKLLQQDYPTFHDLLQFRNQYAIMLRIGDAIAKNFDLLGIVRPYSLESYRNSYVLVMEDFGGVSLRDYTHSRTLDLAQVLEIALQVAEILHNLHQNRVIHKDIKPANILIHPETKRIKLIDFSIASLLPKETQEIKNPNGLEGTLAYLAPEQTGRMNRGIDYRSDYYALGVTLFELLTRQLPFKSDDPMELVHCQIAKQPPSLSEFNLPDAIAQIVAKLMAKNAEDRYQSALGLKYDLEICLDRLQETGKIEAFEIGKRDVCDRFIIPEKLYGREKEVNTLLESFERVSNGTSEMMLVAGFSGIGKTAVINEVHKPILRQRGYFIKGKFDQFNRNIPFSAIVQAFRDLMGQLLSESDVQLATWKAKIINALGDNGQVIIDVIPELERIIGQQPPVPELSGSAAQNRFNLLFEKFISVFATQDHPLVMFLDDLQWTDSASLNLLKLLMSEANSGYLLILGAYRDNEVFPAHPLMLTLEQIEKNRAIVNTITLEPLAEITVNQLVADTLSCCGELAQPLTQLVYQKTQGNPFFTTQFLKGLHKDGWIQFQSDLGYWQCDLAAVRQLSLTDDVVEFMALQLQKLPVETQEVLKLAACIGNQFDLNTLAIVSEQSQTDAATALWKGLQEGFIIPISETYKFFHSRDVQTAEQEISVPYKFLHDRVQQAAYSLIPATAKQSIHLKVGQLLLHNTPADKQEEHIFVIVQQLNQGSDLLIASEPREQLAQLNLIAGQKAKAATAYHAALNYLKMGIDLLTSANWETHYDLTWELHKFATEAAFLSGDFIQMEQYAQISLVQAKTLLDRIPIYEVQIQALVAQNQLMEAVHLGLETLKRLNIYFPEPLTPQAFPQGLAEIQESLAGRSIESLLESPVMTRPESIAAMQILLRLSAVMVVVAPQLMPLTIFKMVTLSIQEGNTVVSAAGYATYGMICCGALGDVAIGNQYGQLALQLLDRFDAKTVTGKTLARVSGGIRHWKEPLADILGMVEEAYQVSVEVGDLETASIAAQVFGYASYFSGKELSELERKMAAYSQAIAQFKQMAFLRWNNTYHQHILNLLGQSENPCLLIGSAYDETIDLPIQYEVKDGHGIAVAHVFKAITCYLFGAYDEAIRQLDAATPFLSSIGAFIPITQFRFYDCLARFAYWKELSREEQTACLEKMQIHQEKLKLWVESAPTNFSHKLQLVEAERSRVLENKLEAIDLYDKAISGAKENGYIQEEAIANELAAKFYLDWGKEKVAAGYMQEAYYCYAKWGAKAKTDDLERRYPILLRPILQPATQVLNPLETLTAIASTNFSIHTSTKNSTSSSTSLNTALDFAAIIKASQSLSSTIQLDELLHQLTQIILQNSGGDRCALILSDRADEWKIAATATSETTELCAAHLEGNSKVPVKLIQHIRNTQELAAIDNLKTELSIIDEYLLRAQPKSILCLPILNQGKLIGILYLENRSTSGVFTSDRILIVNFLCTQAAISLENARLYQQAQEYAQQLEQSQLQIVQSEKMSALGNLVAGVAHEINNPVGFIAGNITEAIASVRDITDVLQLYRAALPNPGDEILEKVEEIDLDYVLADLPNMLSSMQVGCDRIAGISTSLRTFSRADKDYKVPFNLHEGIDSTLLILKHRLKANETRPAIEVATEYGKIPEVTCFPGQLNQVFMNILANAIDALDESNTGRSFAEIQAHINRIIIRTSVEGELIKIAIADNGKGISEQVKAKIFDYLFTTKGIRKGTGLGLAIARQIVVEKHGGSIDVHSEIGKGTEFVLTLPIS